MSRGHPRSRRARTRRRGGRGKWLVAILVAPLIVLLLLYYNEFGLPSRVENAISGGQEALESVQATRAANAEVQHEQYEREILAAVNQERSERGIAPLKWDAELHAIARAHSQDMAEHDYFEHVNLSGQDPGDRARAAGYRCGNRSWEWGIGENLYFGTAGYQSSESPAESWMNSPLHQRAMLSTTFHRAAIGVHKGRLSGYGTGNYTTLLLC